MAREIMTADGPLQAHPFFTKQAQLRTPETQVRLAKGDNGYWYIRIEDLEDISEQVCRFEPIKRFALFVMHEAGRGLRQYWNRKLGAGYEQHVHFTTTQPGYEGTWAIYDLGQAFAAYVDEDFAAHIHAAFIARMSRGFITMMRHP